MAEKTVLVAMNPDQKSAWDKANQLMAKAQEQGDRAGTRGVNQGKDLRPQSKLLQHLETTNDILTVETVENPDLPRRGGLKSVCSHIRNKENRYSPTEFNQAEFFLPTAARLSRKEAAEYIRKTAGLTDNGALQDIFSTDLESKLVRLPDRPLHLSQVIPIVESEAAHHKFARESGFVNNIATFPDIQYDPVTALAYPQVGWSVTEQEVDTKTIAGYAGIPETIIDDVPEAEDALEDRLYEGCECILDTQILAGSNSGNDFGGIQNMGGIQASSWSTGASGDNRADAILNMIVQLNQANYQPDSLVFNNWGLAQIWKMKDNELRYLFPVAHQALNYDDPRRVFYLWGIPAIRTESQTNSSVLVASLKSSCILYVRQKAYVVALPAFLDWALKGLVAVRIRMRGCIQISRPESNGLITMDHAPS